MRPSNPVRLLLAATLLVASFSPATAQFLQNPDFSGATTAPWVAGQNVFLGAPPAWNRFESIAVPETITINANSVTFFSADDGASDLLERYLLQEWSAVGGITPFKTGDVIRFRGRARATRTGANTSDMVVRASIRTLGYINNLSFQLKSEYSAHAPIGSAWADFDISITFPDLRQDDSLQRVAMGFEITGAYDGVALDTATIEFQNLVGTVTSVGGPSTFLGYTVIDGATDLVNTGDWMGFLAVDSAPFVYSYRLGAWMSIDETQDSSAGVWAYIYKPAGTGTGNAKPGFLGYPIVNGSPKTVDTGAWMGVLAVDNAPFIYSNLLGGRMYIDETQDSTTGVWAYIVRDDPLVAAAQP